ncbi:MAG: hypothetical protein HC765_10885 [Brachymonas sp.]|nr:hypothetical protein [Brachymonas sp.]
MASRKELRGTCRKMMNESACQALSALCAIQIAGRHTTSPRGLLATVKIFTRNVSRHHRASI